MEIYKFPSYLYYMNEILRSFLAYRFQGRPGRCLSDV